MKTRISIAVALMLVSMILVVGCGSSATTTPAQARAVAVAETRFLSEWGHAYHVGLARCRGLKEEAGLKCLHRVESPLQGKAAGRFLDSIEAVLDEGVGPECTEALEEAKAGIPSIPSFAGGTRTTCRAESRG
jgi:hypothetical protein